MKAISIRQPWAWAILNTRIYREEGGEVKAVVTTVYKNGNSDTVYYPQIMMGRNTLFLAPQIPMGY